VTELSELVQALLEPAAYPVPPQQIEMAQTQMSFIFFAGDYVYKVKKPVNLGYLDYTTLEKRQLFCRKEVELNQRLCPDAYLGTVAITENKGDIRIEGGGNIIEYAVKMRRLPQDLMLDMMLKQDRVLPDMLTMVAEKLARFHDKAATNDAISTVGGLETVIFNTEENFSQTEKYFGVTINQPQFEHIKAYTRKFIEDNSSLFNKRVADRRIRDCHGDLHSAHICLTPAICIYDCIEFNDRFRYCDVASEIAFLAMDLDHFGRTDLSKAFVDDYIEFSGDKDIRLLLNFYKCYRAYVRGKVNSFKLDDPLVPEAEKQEVMATARSYFELAESYVMD
jgi:aminoglycoside phosphotransferase family enzyme